jgi:hypothetical protein
MGSAWSTQDTPSFLSFFVEEAHYFDVALEKVFRGQKGIKAAFKGTFKTFPDFKMEIGRSAVITDTAAGEWIMSCTFLG